MTSLSLYRRVLGPHFDELPEVLKRFHDNAGGGHARGSFRVVRGDGIVRNIVAGMLRMPRAGENVPIHLEVKVNGASRTVAPPLSRPVHTNGSVG